MFFPLRSRKRFSTVICSFRSGNSIMGIIVETVKQALASSSGCLMSLTKDDHHSWPNESKCQPDSDWSTNILHFIVCK